ncbi:MAG: hypothetical protein A2Y02_00960 [Omnitrophica bacterium GWA2_52_12]|nr:MAG: hypothetical protein A2Y02_00960 [Omnitrophica bacterium GWA2_52_12]
MQPYFRLQITTPQGHEYSGDVVHARIPVPGGSVGILANHAPYITAAAGGVCEVREKDGTEKSFNVGGGFFTVSHNQAVLLTQTFQAAQPQTV